MTIEQWTDFYHEVSIKNGWCCGQSYITTQHIMKTIKKILIEGDEDTEWGHTVYNTLRLQFGGVKTLSDKE